MLVWFAQGWEEFAKWGPKEEAEIARLVFDKWATIKKAVRYVRRHKEDVKEVLLGLGPQGRKYTVQVSYEGRTNQDIMQTIGYAPVTTIGADLMAKSLATDWPSGKSAENILIGHVYDDKNNGVRILGVDESKQFLELINRYFDDI